MIRFFTLALALALLFIIAGPAYSQSRVTTTAGNVYTGTLTHESSESVTILTTDSASVVLARDKILTIEYDRTPEQASTDSTANATAKAQSYSYGYGYTPLNGLRSVIDTAVAESNFYVAAGVAVGTPGGFNLHGALNIERWVMKANAGTVIWLGGAQIGVARKLIWADHFELNLGLVAGEFMNWRNDFDLDVWLYAGPSLEIKIGGFFLEGALTTGAGDYDSPMPLGQVGYRFRLFDLGTM